MAEELIETRAPMQSNGQHFAARGSEPALRFKSASVIGWKAGRMGMASLPDVDLSKFEQFFIEHGRLACEAEFNASRNKLYSYIRALGKKRMLEARAAHVRIQAKGRLRPCPPDFAAAFPYLGLKGCRRRYRADWRQIYRWLDECGREKLIDARRRQTGDRDVGRRVRIMGSVICNAYPVSNLKTAP
jgi:hypothetical protein